MMNEICTYICHLPDPDGTRGARGAPAAHWPAIGAANDRLIAIARSASAVLGSKGVDSSAFFVRYEHGPSFRACLYIRRAQGVSDDDYAELCKNMAKQCEVLTTEAITYRARETELTGQGIRPNPVLVSAEASKRLTDNDIPITSPEVLTAVRALDRIAEAGAKAGTKREVSVNGMQCPKRVRPISTPTFVPSEGSTVVDGEVMVFEAKRRRIILFRRAEEAPREVLAEYSSDEDRITFLRALEHRQPVRFTMTDFNATDKRLSGIIEPRTAELRGQKSLI